MQRKLRRHLNALALSSALSAALPLIALVFAPPSLDRPVSAMEGVAEVAAPAAEVTAAQESAPVQRRRRASSRDALSLPFFSFARTLRRGNGS